MMKTNHNYKSKLGTWILAVAVFLTPLTALAQTRISFHNNSYNPGQDVQLGRQAAAEAEQQLPILRDSAVTNYVAEVGRRLVNAIPPEYQHPEFRYTFKVVDARDINAFALPGGPMYVNRGMIEAARTEGEMAGVMAHEISHVALRHGTAQATKAQKYQIGAIGGAILGSIIGGNVGSVVGQGIQTGLGIHFLKYSREYETEADVLGAQIMARAGYDPRDLANMFRTIERQGGSGGPEFLSDHPNPSNRYQRIEQEAQYLRISDPVRDTQAFNQIQARLNGMPRARSMQEIAQSTQRSPQDQGGRRYPDEDRRLGGRVEYPSSRYRTYTESNLFRVNVPDNWREVPSGNSVWFAPEGAYGQARGQAVFTHGVNIGIARAQSNNLQQATDEFINSLAQGNRNLRQRTNYQRVGIDGRNALSTTLSNVSEATGRPEVVTVNTIMLRNGDLLYMIAVAPQDDYRDYQRTFQTIVRSLQIRD